MSQPSIIKSIFFAPLTVVAAGVSGWVATLAVVGGISLLARSMGGGGFSEQMISTVAWAGALVGFCAGIAMVVGPLPYRNRREKLTYGFPVEQLRSDGRGSGEM